MSLPLWIRWSFTPGQGQIFRVMLRKKWQERHKAQSPNKTRSWSQEQNFQNRWLRVVVDFMKLQMMKYIYRLSERQRSTFVMLSFTEGSLRVSLLSAGTIFHQTHVRVMIISWEREPWFKMRLHLLNPWCQDFSFFSKDLLLVKREGHNSDLHTREFKETDCLHM